MALTTLASVKTHLGISHNQEDARLKQFITQMDALVKSEISRKIEQATYTEYHQGDGSRVLIVREPPIQSVTSIHVDSTGYFGDGTDAFAAATALTEGTDFVIRKDGDQSSSEVGKSGMIFRIGAVWPAMQVTDSDLLATSQAPSLGNIKVVYVGGYASVPADVALAANNIVATIRSTAEVGASFLSENLDYYNYTLTGNAEAIGRLGDARRTLARYKRLVI